MRIWKTPETFKEKKKKRGVVVKCTQFLLHFPPPPEACVEILTEMSTAAYQTLRIIYMTNK